MLLLVSRCRKAFNSLLFAANFTAAAFARNPLLGQVEAGRHINKLVVIVIVHHAASRAAVVAARQTLLLLQYGLFWSWFGRKRLLLLLFRWQWWRYGFCDRFGSAFVGKRDGGWKGHFDGAPDARSEVEAVAAEHPFAEELAVVVGRDEVDAHDHLLVDGDVAEAHKVLAARRLDVACDAHETNGKVGASPRQLAAVLDQPRLLEANVGLQLRAVRYVVVLEERGRERSSNFNQTKTNRTIEFELHK